MVDVVTNLLGEIVEVHEWAGGYRDNNYQGYYSLRARGTVRAVYILNTERATGPYVMVECDEPVYNERAKEGGIVCFPMVGEFRVRVVQFCQRCYSWDRKTFLHQYDRERADSWEHLEDRGCREKKS